VIWVAKPSGNKGVREPLAPLQKPMCLLFGFPDSKAHQAGGNRTLSPPLGAFSWSGNPTENASAFEGGFSGVFIRGEPPNKKTTRQGDLWGFCFHLD
jgi:hypothetical protein